MTAITTMTTINSSMNTPRTLPIIAAFCDEDNPSNYNKVIHLNSPLSIMFLVDLLSISVISTFIHEYYKREKHLDFSITYNVLYLFCNFLLVLVGWAVGEVITNIALEVEEPADSKGELVLTVSDIKTNDGDGITDE